MIILANSLATPAIGTIFWTTFIFLILMIVLRVFAWKPILSAVKAREESIRSSLEAADEARKDMERLKADNEAIIDEARHERDILMKEARTAKDRLMAEARQQAKTEADKIIVKAREEIEREKRAALTQFREQVVSLSVSIAEKILRNKLSFDNQHEKLINDLLDEADLSKN
ncbi:MAG: F0F1 ATP synthase subunit B [Bacteroidales bacterium]|nr:F0F1 ATP synthase subunit B [Bacteroidales bacterium]